jgi:uncharacterized phage protein gp47/JayE
VNREDYLRIARDRIRITPGTTIDPAAIDVAGANLNLIVNGVSAMAEECEQRSAARMGAQLTSSATDADLDRVILERTFGRLPRKAAAPASFAVMLRRTGTSGAVVAAGTEMLAGGLTWTLDAQVVFPASVTGPLPATFTCSSLGSSGNLTASAITGFKNPGLLDDPTTTIEAFVSGNFDDTTRPPDNYASGGADKEKDSDYRARYALYDAGLDTNTDLLAAGALTVPGVAYAVAIEDVDSEGRPTGTATLYLGDVNGRANRALLARVRAALRGFRMTGQDISLVGTVPFLQSFLLSFAVATGYAVETVQAEAVAAVVSYVNALGPGDSLNTAGLYGVLRGIAGLVFLPAYPLGLVSPTGIVAAASPSTLIRTTPALVTFP